jgi:hypothetical protein
VDVTNQPNKAAGRESGKRFERKHVPGVVMPFLVRELLFDLTSAEWKVWTILFTHANRELVCCLKNSTIISESGLGKNSFHTAKRELVRKKWAKNCGQRDGRGANVYKVFVPTPKPVEDFTAVLWEKLNQETWWEKNLGADSVDYSEDHLDWLIAWRVIRALRDADSKLMAANKSSKVWRPNARIYPELQTEAEAALLTTLRRSGTSLNPERGIWWLFGDGYDEARDTDNR